MTRFSLRDKRLFEIIKVDITRVDCIYDVQTTVFDACPVLHYFVTLTVLHSAFPVCL